ncbi:MAG TPA: ATP-binding protein [Kofleriaceae bacterium]|jgi:hypothetical protein|nr:ATP-binding protein [Kofleriaceae bacterium]
MLEYLRLDNVGPAPVMELALAPRLNLLTGDNGLGKSFLLDVAWWALTRKWPRDVNPRLLSGYRARPHDIRKPARIKYRVESKSKPVEYESTYSKADRGWTGKRGRPHDPGLVIYAHADGGFSVWDPARNYWKRDHEDDESESDTPVPAYVFAPPDVWAGLHMKIDGRETRVCKGILDDWALWIREDKEPARRMAEVLASLSAAGETLTVGPLRPISVNDPGDYPTIDTPYGGSVSILHASAGIRKVVALAYMLCWSWERHVAFAEEQGFKRTGRVILIVDELESHLHPRWQRSILRSVLDVARVLHTNAQVQLIAATHSPLIMASAEPLFDGKTDAWFDLDLNKKAHVVELRKRPFVRHGDASRWLTSDAFDLEEARSIPAEEAIREAKAFAKRAKRPLDDAKAIDAKLRAAGLSDIDPFWVRWSYMMDELKGSK